MLIVGFSPRCFENMFQFFTTQCLLSAVFVSYINGPPICDGNIMKLVKQPAKIDIITNVIYEHFKKQFSVFLVPSGRWEFLVVFIR